MPPAEVMKELAAGRANRFHLDHADLVPGSPVPKAMLEVRSRRLTHGRAPG